MFSFLNGNITAQKDEKGLWIYKSTPQFVFKKNGTLKAHYQDLPRYDIIYDIEGNIKKEYNDTVIKDSLKEIVTKLLEF